MKSISQTLTVTAILALAAISLQAAEQPSKPQAAPKTAVAQPGWAFTPDHALPNVLILGDSISIGYTRDVRALLAGQANVFRPISADGKNAENCNGTTKGVKSIDRWLGETKWAVIHFNFGLHDLKHVAKAGEDTASSRPADPRQATVEQYVENLEFIVGKLEATGARLVFATTTPVAPGTTNPLREPEAPRRYNAAALEVMTRRRIRVNDLYGFCEPQLSELQLPKNVHFTAAGSKALAGEVAKVIEQELKAAGHR
jgi:acyl-CoA thioesterase-1